MKNALLVLGGGVLGAGIIILLGQFNLGRRIRGF